ncbi:MAG: acyl carrier protein [Acidobacteriota bacterium]
MTANLREPLADRVIEIVAAALDRKPAEIHLNSSLIDDLDAESIDFLDIRYRIETAFKLKISEEDLWGGTLRLEELGYVTADGVTPEGLKLLKEHLPDLDWGKFPRGVSKTDLPRLVTVSTIVDYLRQRLDGSNKPGR